MHEQATIQGSKNLVKASTIIPAPLRPATFVLVLLLAWTSMFQDSRAGVAAEGSLEYSVKGAYLLKFGDFVEWPASAFPFTDTPLLITVLGDDPFGPMLDQLGKGRAIAGRTVTVRRTSKAEEARNAHILYISQSERNNLKAILASLQDRNILTVADFEHPGIAIAFVIDNDKVRFDVNLDQVEQAGLKVSSKLLGVARTVRGK
ncbi:YfiR family protein [Janthinobacterium sp. 17J80-10]|uniref:YfiR family protein n=1 Tax=Janthinobacterium sp. 17J80-10 TaxID=2497863 RepID=UPI00100530DC|nr:YfiR family protein [Janthinobacterium sp. 17J80-10]QAU35368.1 YfiR family protein [Janthinobacterium sp. 17J80-10]